jgi:hypothetical protein
MDEDAFCTDRHTVRRRNMPHGKGFHTLDAVDMG